MHVGQSAVDTVMANSQFFKSVFNFNPVGQFAPLEIQPFMRRISLLDNGLASFGISESEPEM